MGDMVGLRILQTENREAAESQGNAGNNVALEKPPQPLLLPARHSGGEKL